MAKTTKTTPGDDLNAEGTAADGRILMAMPAATFWNQTADVNKEPHQRMRMC